MRRILATMLAALMILSVVYVGVFTVSADTESDLPANARPIKDGEDFASMQAGGYYYLDADITVDFSYSKNFTGTLDGRGHTITTEMPLFLNLNGATIRNIVIDGEIDDTDFENVYVGALANAAGNGLIENVHNKANVTGYKKGTVGGIVGFNRGGTDLNIVNCSNSGTLTGARVGGIVGQAQGENINITGCKNTGDCNRISTANNGFGGILASSSGNNSIVHINDCVNTGNITGARPGGITGDTISKEFVMTDCINTGDVTSPNKYAGGISSNSACYTRAVYRNCINTGTVAAKSTGSSYYCGGILAFTKDSTSGYDGRVLFYGCVNVGTVQQQDYQTPTKGKACYVGGIAGMLGGRSEFYNCVSAGNVYGSSYAAGLCASVGKALGVSQQIVSGCYVGGTIYSNGGAYTKPTCYAPCGFFAYSYGYTVATNNVVAANLKTDYDIPGTTAKNQAIMSAFVGYSNSGSAVYQNNYFVGTMTAGKNVKKVLCLNSRDADLTARIGTYLTKNHSVIDLPLYYNNTNGLSATKGTLIDKAEYTDEKIVQTLNESLGYEAYTLLTEEDANEYGLVGIFPTSAIAGISDPTATPVAVGTAEEFLAMKSNGSYYLTADITLPSSYAGIFTGILDGRDHTITVANPVFSVLSDASVSNLTIKGTIESSTDVKTRMMEDYRGALANVGLTTVVTNVTNEASVTARFEVGGIFAQMQGGKLVNCVNKGIVTGCTYVGGLVGHVTNEVAAFENCVNNGELRAGEYSASNFGGIVGYVSYTDVYFTGCVNNTNINITSPGVYVGGILGTTDAAVYTTEMVDGEKKARQSRLLVCDVVMTDCVNNGDITAYSYAAGLVANCAMELTITNCVNNGDITSTTSYASGFVAYAATSGKTNIPTPQAINTFKNCVNNGDVVSYKTYASGMLSVASTNVSFTGCVNNGAITGSNLASTKTSLIAGGILGRCYFDAKFEECVNTGNVSGNFMVGGIAGEIGYGVAKGLDGKHEFTRCYVGGSVYNSNAYYPKDTAYMCGTGGLFGTATNTLTGAISVKYCGVTATVTGVTSAIGSPCAIGGLGGYCNTADASYLDNYFAGNLVDAGKGFGVRSLIVYSSSTLIRAANAKGNFTTNNSIVYYHDARGITTTPDENCVPGGASSGELCFRLYDSIGKDVFFQQLGVDANPMPFEGETKYMVRYDKTVPEYYNITRLSDVRPDPSESTTEDIIGDTTDPSDDYTTEVWVPVPTDPADTTTEENPPVVTDPATEPVTEPVTDEVTEPAKDGGCGSVIGASIALAAFALIAPAAVLLKKRDEE